MEIKYAALMNPGAFSRFLTTVSVMATLLVASCLNLEPRSFADDAVDRADGSRPRAHKTLFLDDHHIAEMTGLKRVMHRPVKRALFLPRGETDGIRVQTASAQLGARATGGTRVVPNDLKKLQTSNLPRLD